MRISEEMAVKLYEENMNLRKKIKELEKDKAFIEQCLFLALARTGYSLVIHKEPDDLPNKIEFDLDENVCHEMIIRAKRTKEDWEYWHR